MKYHLLPPNATSFEKETSKALDRINSGSVPVTEFWNSQTCPTALLPWLAFALQVPVWDDRWSEAMKRSVCATAIKLHQHRGTAWAIEEGLRAIGSTATISEWFENGGQPGTFEVEIFINQLIEGHGELLGPDRIAQIKATIDATKRKSSHYSFKLGAAYGAAIDYGSSFNAKTRKITNTCPQAQNPTANSTVAMGSVYAAKQYTCTGLHPAPQTPNFMSVGALSSAVNGRQFLNISMEAA